MASSSAPLTVAETQQLQKLLAKAKSAAAPAGHAVSFPRTEPSYDPTTGLIHHHGFGISETAWDATELWEDDETEFFRAMSDAAKRHEADVSTPTEHHAKRLTVVTGRASTDDPVRYAHGKVPVPYPSGTTEIQLPAFPEGIHDVETWGCTLIAFGMFDKTKTSYMALVCLGDLSGRAQGCLRQVVSLSQECQGPAEGSL